MSVFKNLYVLDLFQKVSMWSKLFLLLTLPMMAMANRDFIPDFPSYDDGRELHVYRRAGSVLMVTLNGIDMTKDPRPVSECQLNGGTIKGQCSLYNVSTTSDCIQNNGTITFQCQNARRPSNVTEYEHYFTTTTIVDNTTMAIQVESIDEDNDENMTANIPATLASPTYARIVRWRNIFGASVYMVLYNDGEYEYIYGGNIACTSAVVRNQSFPLLSQKNVRFHKDYDGLGLFDTQDSDTYDYIQRIKYWQNWEDFDKLDFDSNNITVFSQSTYFIVGSVSGDVCNHFCEGGCEIATKMIRAGSNNKRIINGRYEDVSIEFELFDEYEFNQVTLSGDLKIVTHRVVDSVQSLDSVQSQTSSTLLSPLASLTTSNVGVVSSSWANPNVHKKIKKIKLNNGMSLGCHGITTEPTPENSDGYITFESDSSSDIVLSNCRTEKTFQYMKLNNVTFDISNVRTEKVTLEDIISRGRLFSGSPHQFNKFSIKSSDIICDKCFDFDTNQAINEVDVENTILQTQEEDIRLNNIVINAGTTVKIEQHMYIDASVYAKFENTEIRSVTSASIRVTSDDIEMKDLTILALDIKLNSRVLTLEDWSAGIGTNYDTEITCSGTASLKNIKGGKNLNLDGQGVYTLEDIEFDSVEFRGISAVSNIQRVVSNSVTFGGCYDHLLIRYSTFDTITAICSSSSSAGIVEIEELKQSDATGAKSITLENMQFIATSSSRTEKLNFNDAHLTDSHLQLYGWILPRIIYPRTQTSGTIILGHIVEVSKLSEQHITFTIDSNYLKTYNSPTKFEFIGSVVGLPKDYYVSPRFAKTNAEFDTAIYASVNIYNPQDTQSVNLYDYQNSFFKDFRRYCQPGHEYEMREGSCVNCPRGTYSDIYGINACKACPKKFFYNDEEGQRLCKLCPAGQTTSASVRYRSHASYTAVISDINACQPSNTCPPGKHYFNGQCNDYRRCTDIPYAERVAAGKSCQCGTEVVKYFQYCHNNVKYDYPQCSDTSNQKPCMCGSAVAYEGMYCYDHVSKNGNAVSTQIVDCHVASANKIRSEFESVISTKMFKKYTKGEECICRYTTDKTEHCSAEAVFCQEEVGCVYNYAWTEASQYSLDYKKYVLPKCPAEHKYFSFNLKHANSPSKIHKIYQRGRVRYSRHPDEFWNADIPTQYRENRYLCRCGPQYNRGLWPHLCPTGYYCIDRKVCSAVPKCSNTNQLVEKTCNCGNNVRGYKYCGPGYVCQNNKCLPSCDNRLETYTASLSSSNNRMTIISTLFAPWFSMTKWLRLLRRDVRLYYYTKHMDGIDSIWQVEQTLHSPLHSTNYQSYKPILREFVQVIRDTIHATDNIFPEVESYLLARLNSDAFFAQFPKSIPMWKTQPSCCVRSNEQYHCNTDIPENQCANEWRKTALFEETEMLTDPLNPTWNIHYAGKVQRELPRFLDGSVMTKYEYFLSLQKALVKELRNYLYENLSHLLNTNVIGQCVCHHTNKFETHEICVNGQYCNHGRCSFTPIKTCTHHEGLIRNNMQCICGDTFCDTNQFCFSEQNLCTDSSEIAMEVISAI